MDGGGPCFGIPSVVSGSATHRGGNRARGPPALICDTLDEWIAALDLLVRDEALRRRIGLAARQRVSRRLQYRPHERKIWSRFSRRTVPVPKSPPKSRQSSLRTIFIRRRPLARQARIVHDNVRYLAKAFLGRFSDRGYSRPAGEKKITRSPRYVLGRGFA